jgi:hypothetical protein
MIGNKQKETIELTNEVRDDLNNPMYSLSIIESYKMLLLADIAESLAIIADNLDKDQQRIKYLRETRNNKEVKI